MSNLEVDIKILEPETTLKTEDEGNDAESSTNNNLTAKEDDLKSAETLRESPVQWPERFPGMDEFLTKSDTPIHTPNIDPARILTNANLSAINQFARLPPEQLVDKIKAMQEEIYKLGLRESKEMTRGKLLGIFDRDRLTKTKDFRN
ncbi:protein lin-52 homolog [Drosophila innubila]|uniref:protein lin-52 homolog n=1 Tax=Drosophila innubila TaxID=198719 RepID=UPI00148E753E|nr:protein lin-52 homolog [Drosophila innubila]